VGLGVPKTGFGDSVQGHQARQGQLTFNSAYISGISDFIHFRFVGLTTFMGSSHLHLLCTFTPRVSHHVARRQLKGGGTTFTPHCKSVNGEFRYSSTLS
jgi:hypothetical protein